MKYWVYPWALDPCWSFPRSGEGRRDHLEGTGDFGRVGKIPLCNPSLFGAVDCALVRNVLFWEKQVGSPAANQQGQQCWGSRRISRALAESSSALLDLDFNASGAIPAEEIAAIPVDWPTQAPGGNHRISGWFGPLKPLSFQPLPRTGTPSLSQGMPSPTQTIPCFHDQESY